MANRVYLSKSNMSNPDILFLVRSILSRFDIIVNEFTGGSYSHDQIKGANYLLLLPPDIDYPDAEQGTAVGRGQYEQVKYALDNDIEILIINDIIEEDGFYKILISDVMDVELNRNAMDWRSNYAWVEHNSLNIELCNWSGFFYKRGGKGNLTVKEYNNGLSIRRKLKPAPPSLQCVVPDEWEYVALPGKETASTVRAHLAVIKLLKPMKYGI